MNRESFNFVVYLDVDWNTCGVRNRQHFLVREVARQIEGKGKILAIERPVCPITSPFLHRTKFLSWLCGQRKLRQENANLFIYTPFVLLHNVLASFIPRLTDINRRLLKWQINRLLDKLEFQRDNLVGWIHHPYQLEDVGLAKERFLVYDCHDDYFSDIHDRWLIDMQRREKVILTRADIVLVVSEELLKKMQDKAKRVFLLPNGVDVELFAKAMAPETKVPSDIASLPHPLIGFLGKITCRLNFNLLTQLATLHPKWSFVLVGPMKSYRDLERDLSYPIFRSLPNSHFLGSKPYKALPSYLKGCDACIIPYLLEKFNMSSSPLKLYEYMATGKPIVSVNIPQVFHFQLLVHVANSVKEWEKAIMDSLSEDKDLSQKRLEIAHQNSWANRAEEMVNFLVRKLYW